MTEASITIEDLNSNAKIVHMQGQLDESNIDEKIKEVYANIEKVPKALQLIFDLSSLDYMNSKSIGYLTDIYGKVTEGGGKVIIAGAKPNITDILQVVGLTQIIETVGSIEEAKAKLASTPATTPVAPQAQAVTSEVAPAPSQPQAQTVAASPVQTSSTAATPAVTQPNPPAPAVISPTPVETQAPSPAAAPAPAATTPVQVAPQAPSAAENPTPQQSSPPQVPASEEGTYKFE